MFGAGLKLAVPLVAAALLLTACAESVSTPTTTPPTASAEESPSATPTQQQSGGSPQPAPNESPEPSVDPSTFDLVEGVRTADLAAMPETLLGLVQVSNRAELEQHRALVDYADAVDTLRLGFAAYFLETAESGYVHVLDTEDEHYQTAFRDSVEQLEADGRPVQESHHRYGPIEWDCAETTPLEDFDRDMAVCRTVRYGRVISVTLVALTEPDAAQAPVLGDYLGEISRALEAVGG